jgi:hypothetical protein
MTDRIATAAEGDNNRSNGTHAYPNTEKINRTSQIKALTPITISSTNRLVVLISEKGLAIV